MAKVALAALARGNEEEYQRVAHFINDVWLCCPAAGLGSHGSDENRLLIGNLFAELVQEYPVPAMLTASRAYAVLVGTEIETRYGAMAVNCLSVLLPFAVSLHHKKASLAKAYWDAVKRPRGSPCTRSSPLWQEHNTLNRYRDILSRR